MTKLWELSDQAHAHISQNQYEEAREILERIISLDPQNVDAWDTYISICDTRGALEGLRSQIKHIWDTRVREHDYLSANKRFVLQRLDDKLSNLMTS